MRGKMLTTTTTHDNDDDDDETENVGNANECDLIEGRFDGTYK